MPGAVSDRAVLTVVFKTKAWPRSGTTSWRLPDKAHRRSAPDANKAAHPSRSAPAIPFAVQQQTSPDGLVRLVLPDECASCRVQTINRSSQVPNVEQTVLHQKCSHHTADLARGPKEPALGDVSLAVGTERINQRRSSAVPWTLSHSNEDASVGEDR